LSAVREFEQEMDEFGLTMGSGLFKNAGELRAGRRDRNTAPPCRRRAKIGHDDRGGRATAAGRAWPPVLKSPPLLATSGLTASATPRFVLP
jgi:hypothetical protein